MAKDTSKQERFQSNLSAAWKNRLESARQSKQGFTDVANQCRAFYSEDCGFMWGSEFRNKYVGDIEKPDVTVTINKAFDFVSIIGPYLFWEYPTRYCKPYEPIEVDPAIFGDSNQNPLAQQQFQMMEQMRTQGHAVAKLQADLMQRYQGYSQREQRDPLQKEAARSIVDAMLTGRGLLWPEKYSFPASGRTLTGLFHGKVDDFFIDPDCNDPALKTAKWIARRHVSPVYEVERRFGLKEGSLKEYASTESNDSKIVNSSPTDRVKRDNGQTHDRIVWYEIFSKCGVGTRQHDVDSTLHETFDEMIGDYAYLVVSPHVPYFLNASPEAIKSAEDDDEIMEMLAWPFPSWMDDRWPVAILDFYIDTNSCWPVAPLAPALGWLITMNILVSAAVQNAYENRKQLIGTIESVADSVEEALSKGGSAVIRLKDNINEDINKVVQYLNRPGMNNDIWHAINYCSQEFNKATNLVDFMYAESTTQDRSAKTTSAKEEKSGVRPEKMSMDVAWWMTEAAELEKILAAFEVEGSDIAGLLGPMGAQLWDEFITSADPEEVCRAMSVVCEASEMRRPSRERDTANLQNASSFLIPMFQQWAAGRGDAEGVEPLNAFLKSWGRAMDMDVEEWELPPLAPPPDPEMMQLQQMMQQMELAKGGAETEAKKADAMKKTAEAQSIAGSHQMESAKVQQEFGFSQAERLLQLKKTQQDMLLDRQKQVADFAFKGAQLQQAAAVKENAQG